MIPQTTFAVLLYCAFVVVSAPASIAAWMVDYSTSGLARLENPSGALWQGHAAAVVVAPRPGEVHRFERASWEWLGARTLGRELGFRVGINDPRLSGTAQISVGTRGLHASDASLRIAASSLATYAPALAPAGLSGDLALLSDGVSFSSNDHWQGSVRVEWRGAESTFASVRPLGDYRAAITLIGARAEAKIETVSGVLRLQGRGIWTSAQGLTFDGTAWSDSNRNPQLKSLLAKLGPSKGNGIHELMLRIPSDDSRIAPRPLP